VCWFIWFGVILLLAVLAKFGFYVSSTPWWCGFCSDECCPGLFCFFMESWHAMQTQGNRFRIFFELVVDKSSKDSGPVLRVCLAWPWGASPTWQQHGCQHSLVVRQHDMDAFALVISHLVLGFCVFESRLQLLFPGGAKLALPTAARHCNFRAAHHHSLSSTFSIVAQAHSNMLCFRICLVAAFTKSLQQENISESSEHPDS
jgi:hypothetical protein